MVPLDSFCKQKIVSFRIVSWIDRVGGLHLLPGSYLKCPLLPLGFSFTTLFKAVNPPSWILVKEIFWQPSFFKTTLILCYAPRKMGLYLYAIYRITRLQMGKRPKIPKGVTRLLFWIVLYQQQIRILYPRHLWSPYAAIERGKHYTTSNYPLSIWFFSPNLVATGDTSGCVRIWTLKGLLSQSSDQPGKLTLDRFLKKPLNNNKL